MGAIKQVLGERKREVIAAHAARHKLEKEIREQMEQQGLTPPDAVTEEKQEEAEEEGEGDDVEKEGEGDSTKVVQEGNEK